MRIGLGIHVGNRKKAGGKKAGQITVFPTALALTYNGNAQTLITAGEGTGVMLYKLGDGEWSENLPQATDAGTYTIYYKSSENKKYKESAEYSIETSVAKVTPTLVVPTPKVLTYNTKAQELVVAGSTDWGTLKYSLDNTNWGTEIPKAKNAGVYTLYYRVDGDDNINNIAADSILAPIAEKRVTNPTIVLSQDSYTYNGSACEPTPTVYDGSVIIPSEEYTVSYANNVNAGTATVIISDVVDGNYYVIGTTTFAIAKANATCTAPTTKSGLVYSGSVQSLVNAGTASGGTMYYSLDNENWSTDIPTATNAGSYTIYYKVVGDANHNDIAAASVSNSIAKANATYTLPTSKSGLVYNATSIQLINAGSTNDGTIEYKLGDSEWSTNIPTAINAGSYVVQWRLVGDSNHNDVAASNINVSVAKATRTLSFVTAPSSVEISETDVVVALPSAGSGTVTYSSSNTSIVTVSGNVVTGVSEGTCNIVATIAANDNYEGATAQYQISAVPLDYSAKYLTFIPVEDTTFGFTKAGLSYSTDNGSTWTALEANGTTPTVTAGSKILWKGTTTPSSSDGIGTFFSSEAFDVEGNIMSLLFGDNFIGQTSLSGKDYAFFMLFEQSMVFNAENLVLPATTLAESCYREMFYRCQIFYTPPKLPATTLAENCYRSMFTSCVELLTAPELPARTLAAYCYQNMFSRCSRLKIAPELPARILTTNCYAGMFYQSTLISTVKMAATDISATNCVSQWLYQIYNGTLYKNSAATWSDSEVVPDTTWKVETYTPND